MGLMVLPDYSLFDFKDTRAAIWKRRLFCISAIHLKSGIIPQFLEAHLKIGNLYERYSSTNAIHR